MTHTRPFAARFSFLNFCHLFMLRAKPLWGAQAARGTAIEKGQAIAPLNRQGTTKQA
jgi:hypothetical protein